MAARGQCDAFWDLEAVEIESRASPMRDPEPNEPDPGDADPTNFALILFGGDHRAATVIQRAVDLAEDEFDCVFETAVEDPLPLEEPDGSSDVDEDVAAGGFGDDLEERVAACMAVAEPRLYVRGSVAKLVVPDLGIVVLEHVSEPFFEDALEVTDGMDDARLAKALEDHKSYIEVVLLGIGEVEDPLESIRAVCRLVARAVDGSGVVAIAAPEQGLVARCDAPVLASLCSGSPLDWPVLDTDSLDVRRVGEDDEAFDRARADAQDLWPEFVAAFREWVDGGGEDERMFSVKVGVTSEEATEFMWFRVTSIAPEADRVHAILESDPVHVAAVRRGDTREFEVAEIHDWVFTDDDGSILGGFTVPEV